VQIWGKPIYAAAEDDIETKTMEVENELNKLCEFTEKYYWGKDIDKYLRYHPFAKILIIKPSSFGDIVQSASCASALKKLYPHARVGWVVFSRWRDLLEMFPDVDDVIEWDRDAGIYGFWRLLKRLRKTDFDLIIDLQGLLRSALLAKFAKGRFKIASPGVKECGNFLIDEVYPENSNINAVFRSLEPVRFISGETFKPQVNVAISQDAFKRAQDILKRNNVLGEYLVFIPFARGKGKDWGADNYSVLADLIKEKYPDLEIVVLGTKNCAGIVKSLKITDLCGQTDAKELAAVISLSKIAVGADTGPMHLALFLDIPSVFIFGASDAAKTGPCAGRYSVLVNKSDKKDIRAIKPEEVFAEALKWAG
jgi:ADP-heptose:LPS heptosyltransferase